MPELPEVETTLRGIKPHILNQPIKNVRIRQANLRWPIPLHLVKTLKNQTIYQITRRAKYLLLKTSAGTLLMHLGMSGSLRIVIDAAPASKHDHFEIEFAQKVLRFTDPRRFGAVLWISDPLLDHPLLKKLGPEPLSKKFSGAYLWEQAQRKKMAVKPFLMDNQIVVGVGNIYATESLFAAGIHPQLAAQKISAARYETLVLCIKDILRKAIKKGGTTLKDFVGSDGKPGYFRLELKAYGRSGLSCLRCKATLKTIRLGQRSTVYCSGCQS